MSFPQFDYTRKVGIPTAKPPSRSTPVVREPRPPVMVNYNPNLNFAGNGVHQPSQHQPSPQQQLFPSHQQITSKPSDNLALQRKDINRIDEAVSRLNLEMTSLRQSFEDFAREARMRPGLKPISGDDLETVDFLSETVASVTAKVGEIDGLKMQIEILKRRLKKVEAAGGSTPIDSSLRDGLNSRSFFSPMATQDIVVPISQPADPNWASSNPLKRKELDMQVQKAITSAQRSNMLSDTKNSRHDAIGVIDRAAYTNGQGSFPITGAGETPNKRGPGRPRKGESVYALGGSTFVDGYITSTPTAAVDLVDNGSPSNATLSQLDAIRRRTRQKPIRNAAGVLIRKDGMPDQRSISSPQNLKKVHEKKAGTVGATSVQGDDAAKMQSPLSTNVTTGLHVKPDEYDSLFEASGANTPDVSGDVEMEHWDGNDDEEDDNDDGDQVNGDSTATDKHSGIMKAMFPNGMGSDAQRMNPGAQIFSPVKPKLQDRVDAQMDGVRAAVHDGGADVVHMLDEGAGGEEARAEREDSMEVM